MWACRFSKFLFHLGFHFLRIMYDSDPPSTDLSYVFKSGQSKVESVNYPSLSQTRNLNSNPTSSNPASPRSRVVTFPIWRTVVFRGIWSRNNLTGDSWECHDMKKSEGEAKC